MRLRKIILITLMLFLTSCGGVHDEQSTSSSLNSDIVTELNAKNLDKAEELIGKAKAENPDSALVAYYEAQYYALKAGVDIYSLFPIVKMELFEFALTEWSQIEEYNDRTRTGVEDTLLGNSKEPSSIEDLKKFLDEIKSTEASEIKYKYEVETDFDRYGRSWNEPYGHEHMLDENGYTMHDSEGNIIYKNYNLYCSYYYEIKLAEYDFKGSFEHFDSKTVIIEDISGYGERDLCPEGPELSLGQDFLKNKIVWEIEDIIKDKKERVDNKRYLKAALALFQSVNVISKVPTFDPDRLEYVRMASAKLKEIMDGSQEGERLYDNSQKQLGLLSGFLILSSIKKAIPVDKVKEPTDFLCLANPGTLFDQGPILFEGLKLLVYVSEGTEFGEKNSKAIEKIKNEIANNEDELNEYFNSEADREVFIDGHRDLVEDSCVQ